jgi:ceramide glucosyltransferase
MLFRKSVAQRFGGIGVLARYLAEDYMAGEAMRRLGLKVVLAREPIQQWIGRLKLKEFWQRHIRWGRIRKSQVFLAFLIEPIFGSVVCSVTGSWFFYLVFGWNPCHFFIGQMLLWYLTEVPLLKQAKKSFSLSAFVVWLVREFLAFPLWINIALGNTVNWRGNRLQLKSGGLLASETHELPSDRSNTLVRVSS